MYAKDTSDTSVSSNRRGLGSAPAAPRHEPELAAGSRCAVALPRLPGIQALRGIAITLVLMQHYAMAFPQAGAAVGSLSLWGGVDLFFAISGFVISRSLLAGGAADRIDGAMWRAFWIRRLCRLLPAAWTWLAISVALGFVLAAFGHLQPAAELRGAIAGAFGYANLFWADCHASGTAAGCGLPQLTGSYWSLSLEEQFYALLATALLVMRLRTLAIVLLAGVLMLNALPFHAFDLRWFLRIDALVLGVAVHALCRSTASLRVAAIMRRHGLVAPVTLALYVGIVCAPLISARHPIGVIALSAAGLVWMAACDHRGAARMSRLSAVFGWLGERAYSIYLCHLPVLLVIHEMLWRAGGPATLPGPWLAAAGLGSVVLILFVGTLSHRFLEQPGMQWGKRLTRPATRSI